VTVSAADMSYTSPHTPLKGGTCGVHLHLHYPAPHTTTTHTAPTMPHAPTAYHWGWLGMPLASTTTSGSHLLHCVILYVSHTLTTPTCVMLHDGPDSW
jgi:hypothetical protein